ncbi:MAG: D-tyrosyl-tRNA(Tyr) deacylase [Candidatus Eremiobacteraeota bacterium]|nr:D-tyrosyl-tRNA(Tyr) deacylase [Candidatus Eremiobacteraeota bacterium]MBV9055930.1 D-tyrosyl-tRNA(Tyr) deacylase [Candidatus Eremiobacteraeota bacterium]
MRAVVQRVSEARVRVDGETIAHIAAGLLVLLSVGLDDGADDARAMAEKIAGLRIFPDAGGLMNESIESAEGAVLLVSQFTLHGDVRRGRRPSFIAAAREPQAVALFEETGRRLEELGLSVQYGRFGAKMDVALVNTGPVTILIDTKRLF